MSEPQKPARKAPWIVQFHGIFGSAEEPLLAASPEAFDEVAREFADLAPGERDAYLVQMGFLQLRALQHVTELLQAIRVELASVNTGLADVLGSEEEPAVEADTAAEPPAAPEPAPAPAPKPEPAKGRGKGKSAPLVPDVIVPGERAP